MNEARHCEGCGAQIASDQRYCLRCGKRLVPLGPPLSRAAAATPVAAAAGARASAASGFPGIPADSRTMIANALMALVFGVFVGTALRPDLGGVLGAGQQVIEVPSSTQAAADDQGAAPTGGTGGGSPAPAAGEGAVEPPSLAPLEAAPVSAPVTSEPTTSPGAGGEGIETPQQLLTGTVVRANPVAHSYAVASTGPLVAIHAGKLPPPGTRIAVPILSLSNGTFAEDGKRTRKGTRKKAGFSGTVTFTDPAALTYVVSTRGASVPVHLDSTKTTAADLPPLGAIVTANVTIAKAPAPAAAALAAPAETPAPSTPATVPDPNIPPDPGTPPPDPGTPPAPPEVTAQLPPPPACIPPPLPLTAPKPPAVTLWQKSLRIDGQATGPVDLEGIVQAACLQPAGLVLSADDLRESGKDITLTVPAGLDLSRVAAGQAVDATATIGADGVYTLTGLSSDWGRKAADDPVQTLGDQSPRKLRARRSSVRWRGWTRLPFVIAPRP